MLKIIYSLPEIYIYIFFRYPLFINLDLYNYIAFMLIILYNIISNVSNKSIVFLIAQQILGGFHYDRKKFLQLYGKM